MKKNNKTPKLRFSGYTDDWEQRRVSELCSISTGKSNTQDKVEDGEYPFYVRSPIIERSTKYLYDEEAVITVGDGVGTGKVFHYVNGKYDLHQRCYRIYGFSDELNAHYFYHTFSKLFCKRVMAMTAKTSVDSVRLEMIADMKIPTPTIEEQIKIGEYFDVLDHLIILHQRKLEKLQNMKKSCLQKMFPKDGATVPEIRFSEFQGDWEERTLGSCFDERLESLPDGELLSVTIGSGIKKFSELDRHDNSNTDKSKYKRVCIGDIAYNSMRMWQGASGRSPYEGIVSPAYTVVKPIGDIDTQFFAYMFKKKEIIHLFEINSQGLTSDTWNLKYPAFSKIVVRVPRNVEEQSRIARFLLELDELISCTEQEIEITKRMKKGCLQKMFV